MGSLLIMCSTGIKQEHTECHEPPSISKMCELFLNLKDSFIIWLNLTASLSSLVQVSCELASQAGLGPKLPGFDGLEDQRPALHLLAATKQYIS